MAKNGRPKLWVFDAMLTIRQAQIDAMDQAGAAARAAAVGDHLAASGAPDDAVARGVQLVNIAGVTGQENIARLLDAVSTAEGIPAALPRPALAILLAKGEAPQAKLAKIENWAAAGKPTGAAPLAPLPSAAPGGTGSAQVQACPFAAQHWIEIEMLDEEDAPVPWLAYVVVLPDSTRASGYLDGDGYARIRGLALAGTCQISFPEIDKDAWSAIDSCAERAV
jgi:hypothetical protein